MGLGGGGCRFHFSGRADFSDIFTEWSLDAPRWDSEVTASHEQTDNRSSFSRGNGPTETCRGLYFKALEKPEDYKLSTQSAFV